MTTDIIVPDGEATGRGVWCDAGNRCNSDARIWSAVRFTGDSWLDTNVHEDEITAPALPWLTSVSVSVFLKAIRSC